MDMYALPHSSTCLLAIVLLAEGLTCSVFSYRSIVMGAKRLFSEVSTSIANSYFI